MEAEEAPEFDNSNVSADQSVELRVTPSGQRPKPQRYPRTHDLGSGSENEEGGGISVEDLVWSVMEKKGFLADLKGRIAKFVQVNGCMDPGTHVIPARANQKILQNIFEYLEWVGMRNTSSLLITESPFSIDTVQGPDDGEPKLCKMFEFPTEKPAELFESLQANGASSGTAISLADSESTRDVSAVSNTSDLLESSEHRIPVPLNTTYTTDRLNLTQSLNGEPTLTKFNTSAEEDESTLVGPYTSGTLTESSTLLEPESTENISAVASSDSKDLITCLVQEGSKPPSSNLIDAAVKSADDSRPSKIVAERKVAEKMKIPDVNVNSEDLNSEDSISFGETESESTQDASMDHSKVSLEKTVPLSATPSALADTTYNPNPGSNSFQVIPDEIDSSSDSDTA